MNKAVKFFIYSIPFFNFYIAPNISFSDVGLVFLVFSIILNKKKSFFNFKNFSVNFLHYLFLWSILAIIILTIFESVTYIDHFGFFKNSLRFIIVIYLFKNAKFLFRNSRDLKEFPLILVRTVKFVCILGFIEFLLQFIGIKYSYFIEGITTTTSRQTEQFFRISSVFNEPSYLGIYLNFSLITLSEIFKRFNVISRKQYTNLIYLIILTLLLARSLIGFSLFLIVLMIYSDILFKKDFFKNKVIIYVVLSMVLLGTVFINSDRISDVVSLKDGSGNHRLLGTYELATVIYKDFVLTGIGLGQQRNFLDNAYLLFQNHYYKSNLGTGSGINNMFILVFFQLGSVGLLIYFILIYRVFRKEKGIFLFFIISGFGWAYMFNPLYWFSISILNIFINGKEKDTIYIN